MHSCIYEGIVTHRRREPVDHRFQYRLFMVYLDLDELPGIVERMGLDSDRRFAARSFRRADHLFDPSRSLADEVRDVIRERTGQSAVGPIRLLTQLRYFGYYMSPLNLFYVFDGAGRQVEYVVAEVNNTPWNERHLYVLWSGNRADGGAAARFHHAKDFHVSPFMDMDLAYRWQLGKPGRRLRVHLANYRASRQIFDARLLLERRELNRRLLRRMTFRYPLMTARITAAIYFQALQLWWKQCPFYPHPDRRNSDTAPAPRNPGPKTPTIVS